MYSFVPFTLQCFSGKFYSCQERRIMAKDLIQKNHFSIRESKQTFHSEKIGLLLPASAKCSCNCATKPLLLLVEWRTRMILELVLPSSILAGHRRKKKEVKEPDVQNLFCSDFCGARATFSSLPKWLHFGRFQGIAVFCDVWHWNSTSSWRTLTVAGALCVCLIWKKRAAFPKYHLYLFRQAEGRINYCVKLPLRTWLAMIMPISITPVLSSWLGRCRPRREAITGWEAVSTRWVVGRGKSDSDCCSQNINAAVCKLWGIQRSVRCTQWVEQKPETSASRIEFSYKINLQWFWRAGLKESKCDAHHSW